MSTGDDVVRAARNFIARQGMGTASALDDLEDALASYVPPNRWAAFTDDELHALHVLVHARILEAQVEGWTQLVVHSVLRRQIEAEQQRRKVPQ